MGVDCRGIDESSGGSVTGGFGKQPRIEVQLECKFVVVLMHRERGWQTYVMQIVRPACVTMCLIASSYHNVEQ